MKYLPERFLLFIINFKFLVTILEGGDLAGAHGLVLVKLAEAADDLHHLVHAGLLAALHRRVAHNVLQTQRKFLNKRNIFILENIKQINISMETIWFVYFFLLPELIFYHNL